MGAVGDGVAAQMAGGWERGRVGDMDGDDGEIRWRWLQLGRDGGLLVGDGGVAGGAVKRRSDGGDEVMAERAGMGSE